MPTPGKNISIKLVGLYIPLPSDAADSFAVSIFVLVNHKDEFFTDTVT